MRVITILLISLLLIPACKHKRKLSLSEFTEVYKDSLSSVYKNSHIITGSDMTIYAIDTISTDTSTINLVNIYKVYQSSPDSLLPILNLYCNALRISKGNNNTDTVKIYPLIKPDSYIANGNNLYFQKLCCDINVVFAVDHGSYFTIVTKSDFDGMKISEDSIKSLAIKNFKSLVSNIKVIGEGKDIIKITIDGNYEPSLVLLNNVFYKENLNVDGYYIVGIPNRDKLFVTGSDNANNVRKLRKMTLKYYESEPYPLTPNLFKMVDGQLTPY